MGCKRALSALAARLRVGPLSKAQNRCPYSPADGSLSSRHDGDFTAHLSSAQSLVGRRPALTAVQTVSQKPGFRLIWSSGGAPASVDASARIHQTALIGPGAVVLADVEIGEGCHVGAGSVIGPDVQIGMRCRIEPHVSVSHCTIGDDVVLWGGVRVGQVRSATHLPNRAAAPQRRR
jgi:hypothetical protein